MAIIFDATELSHADRAHGLHVALAQSSLSSVDILGPERGVGGRLEMWTFGRSYLFRAATSPVRMYKTEVQARRNPVPLLAVAVQQRCCGCG